MSSAWKIKWNNKAEKQFKQLDYSVQKRIRDYLYNFLAHCDDPKSHGKRLVANLSGKWRFRVGNYRVVTEIYENELVIQVVEAGHRKDVY